MNENHDKRRLRFEDLVLPASVRHDDRRIAFGAAITRGAAQVITAVQTRRQPLSPQLRLEIQAKIGADLQQVKLPPRSRTDDPRHSGHHGKKPGGQKPGDQRHQHTSDRQAAEEAVHRQRHSLAETDRRTNQRSTLIAIEMRQLRYARKGPAQFHECILTPR